MVEPPLQDHITSHITQCDMPFFISGCWPTMLVPEITSLVLLTFLTIFQISLELCGVVTSLSTCNSYCLIDSVYNVDSAQG